MCDDGRADFTGIVAFASTQSKQETYRSTGPRVQVCLVRRASVCNPFPVPALNESHRDQIYGGCLRIISTDRDLLRIHITRAESRTYRTVRSRPRVDGLPLVVWASPTISFVRFTFAAASNEAATTSITISFDVSRSTNTNKMAGTNGNGNGTAPRVGTDRVKQGLAQMLKGGVIVSTLVSDDADGRSRDGGGGRMASVLLTSIPQNCMAKL